MSGPMHTALRLGVRAAERIRALNPACHIAFYGMYAHLNADYLLEHVADSVLGAECEAALVSLVQALEAGGTGPLQGVPQPGRPPPPVFHPLPFLPPSPTGHPSPPP